MFAPIGQDMPYRVYISEDPIGFEGGTVNLYEYAENNPMLLIDPLGLCSQQNSPLKDMAKGVAFGFMAAGVVTVEVAQIVAQDVVKALVTEKIPATLVGSFATDKSITLIETTKNVAGDMREVAERIGRRIDALRKWWYGR